MKLDKLTFAKLIGYLGRQFAIDFNGDELAVIDDIIDVQVEQPQGATPEQLVMLFDALVNKRTIDAIKLVRSFYGMGLKDAKDFVEQNYCHRVADYYKRDQPATLGDILNKAVD